MAVEEVKIPDIRDGGAIVEALIEKLVREGQLPLAMKIPRACKLVDFGQTRFYQALKEGDLRAVMVGGQRRIHLADLLDWIGRDRELR